MSEILLTVESDDDYAPVGIYSSYDEAYECMSANLDMRVSAINADREVPDGIVPVVYVFWQRNDYGWERLEVLEA